jgi:hypothetical protein
MLHSDWDVLLTIDHPDYLLSGLHVPSVIRPLWLGTFPDNPVRLLGNVTDDVLDTVRFRIISALSQRG